MMGPPQKAKHFKGSARRLLARLGPSRAGVLGVIACALASVGLGLSGPVILGRGIDIVFDYTRGAGMDFDGLSRILVLLAGLYAASSLFAWLQGYLLNIIVQRTVRQLRTDAHGKLARLPLAYFDRHPHGELLSRITNDIDNVAQSLQQTLSQLLTGGLNVVGILVLLVVISPLLALVTLVTVPLSVVVTAQIGKRSAKRFAAQWAHVGALNGQIEEAFTGHALVNVLGRRRQVEARFDAKNEELFDAGLRAQFLSSMIMPAINFVGNLTYVGIAVVGGMRVASQAMRLGSVQAFIQLSRQFSQQLGQLAAVANVAQSGVASAERVFELLDAEEQPAERVTSKLAAVKGHVVFEHVSFRYQPDRPLIEDLSLEVQPGQTVAIVGPTGAGKTTLVNLLLRFYELDGGRILLDGVDIATLSRDDLRSRIGMVLQDTWLFADTIRANIAFGNERATDAEITAAAEAAHVDRFVRALPAGYGTQLDPDATNLSAGEKQLVTIARAFLADPSLLVLDEATSSVDTRTEVLVQAAMSALRAQRTSFVIAHRLSTIRDADVILVMEEGRIVEQGSHAQLLAADGAYAKLHAAQARL